VGKTGKRFIALGRQRQTGEVVAKGLPLAALGKERIEVPGEGVEGAGSRIDG